MKQFAGIVTVCMFAALLSACPFNGNDVSKLRHDLGSFQYIGLNPQLSFVVQKADFQPSLAKDSHATLTYTVSIKQNNKSFPLNEYLVMADASIQDAEGHEIDRFLIKGKVVDGVLSTSDVNKFYYSKVNDLPAEQVTLLRLKVKSYQWHPDIVEFEPYDSAAAK